MMIYFSVGFVVMVTYQAKFKIKVGGTPSGIIGGIIGAALIVAIWPAALFKIIKS